MSLPTIFHTCRPRAEVLGGTIRDDEFMADFSRVVNGTAPTDYLAPAAFFAKSYPTRGMKELLKPVCPLNSTEEDETPNVPRARLFAVVDPVAAEAGRGRRWGSERLRQWACPPTC